MFETLHQKRPLQLLLGLLFGFCFGFLLQKGGVCNYDVIMNQLLLKDFTVLKIIFTAVAVGMVGVYAMHQAGWVKLHKKSGSWGTTLPGPLLFGIGFGLLGYCPGTGIGAFGHGALDAFFGGILGMLLGCGVYAAVYPRLKRTILDRGDFGEKTLVDLLPGRSPWPAVLLTLIGITLALAGLEQAGL